jgi:hydrogenase maturation protease
VKPTAVIGLGNPIRRDEGIGVRIVARLADKAGPRPDVEFIDAGTKGTELLHAMPGRRKVVVVDCCYLGEPPGTLRRFRPDDVRTRKGGSGLSVHEGDALRMIALSETLGECPEEVVIFGIEPEDIGFGRELTETLERRLDEYVSAIEAELSPPTSSDA